MDRMGSELDRLYGGSSRTEYAPAYPSAGSGGGTVSPAELYLWVSEWRTQWTWQWRLEQEIYGVPIEQWVTAFDERTCPECGAVAGSSWDAGEGWMYPPLHNNCRCAVVISRIDWRTRWVEVWRLVPILVQTWEQRRWREGIGFIP